MTKSWLANIPQFSTWLRDKWFLLFPGLVFLLLFFGFSTWAGLDPVYGLPIFQISGWSLVFIIPLTFLVLGMAWLQFSLAKTESPRGELISAFIFFGVGLLFLSSQNALALLLAWGFLDLGFLWIMARSGDVSPGLGLRAARWNLLGMLGWLVFAVTGFGGPVVLLALWVRLGIYPAMQILLSLQSIDWPARNIVQMVAITSGGYLLTVNPGLDWEGIPRVIASSFAFLAMVWGIFSLWREGSGEKAGFYIYQVQLGFLLLVMLSGLTLPPAVAFLFILSLLLGWALYDAASRISPSLVYPGLNLIPLAVAGANWVGLPFTLGFGPRLWIYNSLVQEGKIWLLGVGAVSLILILPSFVKTFSALSSQKRESLAPRATRIWLWLLTLATLALGIYPDPLLSLGGPVESQITLWGLARTLPPSILFWLLLLILAPLLIGYFVLRLVRRRKVEERYLETASLLLDLGWLYSILNVLLEKLGNILRRVAAFGEDRGSWGWAMFLAILVLLWVLGG